MLPFSSPPIVSLSARHHTGLSLLARCGFQIQQTLSQMRRGQPFQRDTRHGIYGMDSLVHSQRM